MLSDNCDLPHDTADNIAKTANNLLACILRGQYFCKDMQNKVCGKKYADGQKFPLIHTDSGVAASISAKKQAFDSFKKTFFILLKRIISAKNVVPTFKIINSKAEIIIVFI